MSLLERWPDLLTLQEAAEILRVDPATMNELIRAGEIIFAKIAGKPLIPKQYLANFIEKIASCAIMRV